ncbi:MAG: deoxyribodipyrimidine photo-lyase [Candidatus Latescibacteria bacterium]|nr:deoxyribodipyrimidine photo-lyase [Candidatus Latescibacterota bacterium]NIO56152.1 deoxyribodipyrimidine photo-lyase [Candidatus Latescibacterota bacterium]
MPNLVSIMWFRQDLRVANNPAFVAAVESGRPVVPLFIWHAGKRKSWAPGTASRWWLVKSLENLASELAKLSSRLIVREGEPHMVLDQLTKEIQVNSVFWNRRYEPSEKRIESRVNKLIRRAGMEIQVFNSNLLFDPDEIKTGKDEPYKVFTPFWNACLSLPSPIGPLPAPRRIQNPEKWPASESLDELGISLQLNSNKGRFEEWNPGTLSAQRQMDRWISRFMHNYSQERDRPDHDTTSRLSPHLHFGEISPHQIWHAVKSRISKAGPKSARISAEAFLRQIGWREFAYYLLHHYSNTVDEPMRPEFDHFPWHRDIRALKSWKNGSTGYPIVDAGMRQLAESGWIHNRVRMIVASFLVKHLLIPWQEGAKWFWENLVDADLASNTLGWQWVAGCGADAAPYFRVFNPVLQGEKFDPDGKYVRKWIPEIASIPNQWVHKPWQAPPTLLSRSGVRLGKDYPRPIVDHSSARRRALDAYDAMRKHRRS